MKAISTYILMAFLCCSITNAQQQVIATGGDYNNTSSGSISWTLGEAVIETYAANGQVLTQGFQQGNLTVNDYIVSKDLNFEISAFPNPASDYISLKIGNLSDEKAVSQNTDMLYVLIDLEGKTLQNGKLLSGNQQINLNNIPVGTYLLSVKGNNNLTLKTFKIVKQ